jgi:ribosomal protein L31E
MAQKTETKIKATNMQREYVIPLREKCRPVARYKKTNKAIKTIKEFLVKHMGDKGEKKESIDEGKKEEEKKDVEEKKASVVEEGAKQEKVAHQEAKHKAQAKPNKQEHQVRKTLSR